MNSDFAGDAAHTWSELVDAVDPLEHAVGIRIRRLALRLDRAIATAVRQHSFEVLGDFQVAALLARKGAQRPSVVAEQLLISRAAMSGRLERLERIRFVRRRPDPGDNRAAIIELTSLGQRRTRQAVADIAELYTDIFTGIDESSVLTADRVLTQLVNGIIQREL